MAKCSIAECLVVFFEKCVLLLSLAEIVVESHLYLVSSDGLILSSLYLSPWINSTCVCAHTHTHNCVRLHQ